MIEGKFKTKDIRIVWYNEHANEKVEYLIYVIDYWFNPANGVLYVMRFGILEGNILIDSFDYGVVINEYERNDILNVDNKNNRLAITIEA